jgi:hypothetical protein
MQIVVSSINDTVFLAAKALVIGYSNASELAEPHYFHALCSLTRHSAYDEGLGCNMGASGLFNDAPSV